MRRVLAAASIALLSAACGADDGSVEQADAGFDMTGFCEREDSGNVPDLQAKVEKRTDRILNYLSVGFGVAEPAVIDSVRAEVTA